MGREGLDVIFVDGRRLVTYVELWTANKAQF
jgi:hypothetical protein